MDPSQITMNQSRHPPSSSSKLKASDILALSNEILRCALLDDAGRILSYAESESGKAANLPSDAGVTVRSLVIHGLSESLPPGLGKVRFTTVVTDLYRLVTLDLSGRIAMLALPLSTNEEPICEEAFKKFGHLK